jgi:hypothetical protein
LHRAAEATIREFDNISYRLIFVIAHLTRSQQVAINPHLAKFIHQHRNAAALIVLEQMAN